MLSFLAQPRQHSLSTPSFAAVAEPINERAVGRWKAYEHHLAPILPVLQPFVDTFGYESSKRHRESGA